MATKLKNISYSKFSKTIAFILAAFLLTSSLTIFVYLANNTKVSFETLFNDDYLKSVSLRDELRNIAIDLTTLLKNYKSENYIKKGGTFSENINDYPWELRDLYKDFKNTYYENNQQQYENNSKEYVTLSEEELFVKFENKYAKEIKSYKNKYINRHLNNYYKLVKRINNIPGLHYYISSGEYEYNNTSNNISRKFFESQPVYILFDENGYSYSQNLTHCHWTFTSDNLNYYPQDIMYVALDDEFLAPKISQWHSDRKIIVPKLIFIIFSIIGFFLCMIYLIFTCGKHNKDSEIHLLYLDKLFLDINIVITFCIIVMCIAFIDQTFRELRYWSFIPSVALSSIVSINLFLSLVRHIKNRTVITHNLSYKLLRLSYKLLRKLLLLPQRLFRGAPIAIRMFPTLSKANDLKNIMEGIEHIKNGELDYVIKSRSRGIFRGLADNINSITDGLKAAVSNELKSERLKTELISNVSHDIRTPLTSIITYIDLLKNEGLDSKNAEKYLSVLDQKSLRLKTLTDDLFEASKASSGSIAVNLEKVEITSLLTQCMGELNSKIISSELDFQFNYPKEKVFTKADGRLLWRVIENLMSNIFKYALKNTRVYIDVVNSDNSVSIILKNISAYKLNINANELIERFTRGDESRTSEGSGLGLSIAKSLVELQNGTFSITVDGDLFKSTITIPKYEE